VGIAGTGGEEGEGMTPSPHSLTVAAIAALAASALAAAPSQASTQVESLAKAAPVAAYDGTAMWSRLDAATGRFQLVQSVEGAAPTLVAVPERDGAFDVDLGSNRAGSTYAVYTRHGDIYRLNPRSGVEKKLDQLSSPKVERNPTIQRGRIAFLRHDGGMDQLRIGDTTSGSKGTRLLLKREFIQSIELGVSHVAWVDSIAGSYAPVSHQRVHIHNIATGAERVVYSAGSGGASFSVVTKPSFLSDLSGFVWARSRIGAPGSRIVKYTLRGSKLSYAQGTSRNASVAWLGDELGAVVSTSMIAGLGNEDACYEAGVQYCSIQYTGPLSFDLKP
jgi:hypothetical protein